MATPTQVRGLRASRRASGASSPGPSGLPTRRRWGRVGAGAAAVVAGAWIAAALVTSAGSRTDAVVLANDVGRYETIERDDLRIASIAVEPGVSTVPGNELDDIVGRAASTDLRAGGVLSQDQLVPAGERLVQDGEAIVGARLSPGDAPLRDLSRGSEVLVVVRPAAGTTGDIDSVEGWLLDLGDADATTGDRSASLVVPRLDADEVAAAAADKRISIVALEE